MFSRLDPGDKVKSGGFPNDFLNTIYINNMIENGPRL